jgi:hypothetical protein
MSPTFYIIFAGVILAVGGYAAFEIWTGRKRCSRFSRIASVAENTSSAVLILDHDGID